MQITTQAACQLLKEQDNIVILAHQKPDGDTLGSSFALLHALESLGKTVRVECADGFPQRYFFLCGGYIPKAFEAGYVVSVDVAGLQLLGSLAAVYNNCVDLCIDHHVSNDMPCGHLLLDTKAAATAQIIYKVVEGLGAEITKPIADCIFTGLSTDTGCFKYDNVTPETHRIAARMIEAGADHGQINKLMFDTMSKGRLEVDKQVTDTLEYHFDDRCAVITIFADVPKRYGVTEEELDGISAKPRKIEGVQAGVTIREREDGTYRISVRSGDGVDASRICRALGGGGHKNAAGCTITGTLESAKETILDEVGRELERLDKQ